MHLSRTGPGTAMALSVIALVLLALAPFGWRLGWWPYRFGLYWLMPGWTIIASDADTGHIEASQQSRWFRFTDDIVIRVSGDVAGSRIDMRSTSRQGHSDYGVNAARIRVYLGALRKRIG